MPDPDDKSAIQNVPGSPAPAFPTKSVEIKDEASGKPGEFSALRAFPSNEFQKSELPPPLSPIAELVGGAIAGFVGGVLCSAGVGMLPVGILLGCGIGLAVGYWVSLIFERAGFLSGWTIIVNVFRVPLFALLTVLRPHIMVFRSWEQDRDHR